MHGTRGRELLWSPPRHLGTPVLCLSFSSVLQIPQLRVIMDGTPFRSQEHGAGQSDDSTPC